MKDHSRPSIAQNKNFRFRLKAGDAIQEDRLASGNHERPMMRNGCLLIPDIRALIPDFHPGQKRADRSRVTIGLFHIRKVRAVLKHNQACIGQ